MCANPKKHELQADEQMYCSTGKWTTTDMNTSMSPYEIRNVDGDIVVKYWGNDELQKSIHQEKFHLETDSKFYCVRKREFKV